MIGLNAVNPGFQPDHLLTGRISLAGAAWIPDRRRAYARPAAVEARGRLDEALALPTEAAARLGGGPGSPAEYRPGEVPPGDASGYTAVWPSAWSWAMMAGGS